MRSTVLPEANHDSALNDEHDRLYELSCDLTDLLQTEFGHEILVQCDYDRRDGYLFRLHHVIPQLYGKVADRARDWLASTTPYRFKIETDDL